MQNKDKNIIENTDDYYMLVALKEAKKALKKDEVPIGAILVKDNEIVAKGFNQKNESRNSFKHAEMIVLKKYQKKIKDWHFNDLTLYTTLEPCPMCAGAILNFRVGKVVFGAYDKKAGSCGTVIDLLDKKEFNHRPMHYGGVCEKECSEILTNYFKEKRKK